MAQGRLALITVAGLVAALGVILGATVQDERVLTTDPNDLDAGPAAGYLVALTALLPAMGVAAAAMLLSHRRWRIRLAYGAGVFASTYLIVQLVQAGFPNYIVVEEMVTMSLTLLANNTVGGGGTMGPILVVAWALLVVWVLLLRGLLSPERPAAPAAAHGAWTLAAVPLLAAAAWGPVEVMLSLPAGSRHTGAHSVLLALEAAILASLLAAHVMCDHALRRATEEPRLADWGHETARLGTRIQLALGAALLLLATAGAFLHPLEMDVLQAGLTWGTTLRAYHVLQVLLLLPLLPALRHRQAALDLLGTSAAPPPLARDSIVPAAAAFVAAGIIIWPTEHALWPWLAAAVVPVAWAWPFSHRAQATLALWAAYVLWAFGNTVTATFRHGEDITIRFTTNPGVSALWQLAAVAVAGTALARAAADGSREPHASTRTTLALLLAGTLAVALWLELPLAAWQVNTLTGDGVAIGSLPSSQDPSVRGIMHAVAAIGITAAALLAARLQRPEWFSRRRGPVPVDAPADPAPEAAARRRAVPTGTARSRR